MNTNLPSTSVASLRPHSQTLITEPDAGLSPIYELLSSATTSIDITMYELADTEAQQILANQASKGVKVRVILDQNLERSNNTAAFTFLSQNGVDVVWANPAYAATHQKTITVDGRTSAIMTLNLTSRYYSTSRDFVYVTTNCQDIAAIETTFIADFTAATITPPQGADLVWSPTTSEHAIVKLIHSATKTLAIENEEMSEPHIVSALAAAAKRSVAVQITMSANPAYATELESLATAGAEIRTYAQTAPLYIHAKIILADIGLPHQKAFLGSQNFSTYSLTKNRELGLVFTDAAILGALNTTLAADFAGGTPFTSAVEMLAVQEPVRTPS